MVNVYWNLLSDLPKLRQANSATTEKSNQRTIIANIQIVQGEKLHGEYASDAAGRASGTLTSICLLHQ